MKITTKNDKQKRIWGYKGQMIGKTSGPGPWSLEQEYNEETIAGAARGIKAMKINITKQYDNTHFEAHNREGALPETYTKERRGRAEGLELEVEFGLQNIHQQRQKRTSECGVRG